MVIGANEVVQTNWQTVDITRALSNVRQIGLQGNRVLFGAQGGIIYNRLPPSPTRGFGRQG